MQRIRIRDYIDYKAKQVVILGIKFLVLQSEKTVINAGAASQNHLMLLLPPVPDGGRHGLIYWGVCGKRFISSNHLKGHMKTHLGQLSFPCTTCKAAFSWCCTVTESMVVS